MLNVPDVIPGFSVREPGMFTAEPGSALKYIVWGALGTARLTVTVPVDDFPLVTSVGETLKSDTVMGFKVRAAVF